jgi:hypothetical protein
VTVSKSFTRNGQTNQQVVVSDVIGVGGYSTVLEQDQRYLLKVIDTETGNRRTVGPYVATQAETVRLEIAALDFENQDPQINYEWGASFQNETAPAIDFRFSSDDETTVENLDVEIVQRDGNVTLLDKTFDNPGTVKQELIIPIGTVNAESAVWEVTWTATIGGEQERGSEVVGQSSLGVPVPEMSQGVLTAMSVLFILMIAGLFSQANVAAGGVVTSLTAGGLFFVGALPGSASGLLIATALVVSIIAYARNNQEIAPK